MNNIVIIGSGLAGYNLAKEIRKLDKEIPVQIITQDHGDFYSKPMISNAFGKNLDAEKLKTNSAEEMAETFNLEILTNTTVVSIDRTNKQVITTNASLPYAKLVLALGAQPIRLPFEGNAADDVYTVNSIYDYEIFRKAIQNKKHITILGAGLIGCEFANDLSSAGFEIELIDLANQPLGNLLHEKPAQVLKDKLSELGVKWHLGHSLKTINHSNAGYELTLDDGTSLRTETVLSAIGLRANIKLAQEAGLNVNKGIIANEYLQTSDENIYTLGDCAEINGRVLPFIMPIMVASQTLAQTLTDKKTVTLFPVMPVVVKTPIYPIVVCPPAPNSEGYWKVYEEDYGIITRFEQGKHLLGFAVTEGATKYRLYLADEVTKSLRALA